MSNKPKFRRLASQLLFKHLVVLIRVNKLNKKWKR